MHMMQHGVSCLRKRLTAYWQATSFAYPQVTSHFASNASYMKQFGHQNMGKACESRQARLCFGTMMLVASLVLKFTQTADKPAAQCGHAKDHAHLPVQYVFLVMPQLCRAFHGKQSLRDLCPGLGGLWDEGVTVYFDSLQKLFPERPCC